MVTVVADFETVITTGFDIGCGCCVIGFFRFFRFFGLGMEAVLSVDIGDDVATVVTTFGAAPVVVVLGAVSAAGALVVATAPPIVDGGVVLIGLLFLRGVCLVRGETGAFPFGAGGIASFGSDATAGDAANRFDLCGECTSDLVDAFTGTATLDPAFDAPPLSPVATCTLLIETFGNGGGMLAVFKLAMPP